MRKKVTRRELLNTQWIFKKRISRNIEIWKKGEKLLMWNRELLKVYRII